MRASFAIPLATLAVLVACQHVKALELLVVGDSMSDNVGNLAKLDTANLIPIIHDPVAFPSGRISDGPLWVAYVQNFTGAKAVVVSTAGARSCEGGGFFAPSIAVQYNLSKTLTSDNETKVVTLWIGHNDLQAEEIVTPISSGADTATILAEILPLVDSIAACTKAAIDTMAAAGETKLLLMSVAPMYDAPFKQSLPASGLEAGRAAIDALNTQYRDLVSSYQGSGIDVRFVDFHGAISRINTRYLALGFSNNSADCLILSTPDIYPDSVLVSKCQVPEDYVWYFTLHLTSYANSLLAPLVVSELSQAGWLDTPIVLPSSFPPAALNGAGLPSSFPPAALKGAGRAGGLASPPSGSPASSFQGTNSRPIKSGFRG